jgi:hypothetical protein
MEERDKPERELFAQKCPEMHRLVREPDGSMELYLLGQIAIKNLLNPPELPNSILKRAAKGGVCDDMRAGVIVVRHR